MTSSKNSSAVQRHPIIQCANRQLTCNFLC